jgi:hypothetical protein
MIKLVEFKKIQSEQTHDSTKKIRINEILSKGKRKKKLVSKSIIYLFYFSQNLRNLAITFSKTLETPITANIIG